MKKAILYFLLSVSLQIGRVDKMKLDTPLDEGAQYGWAVDMSDDFIIVGGPEYYHQEGKERYRCGTVLIFQKKSDGDYAFFQRLLPPDPAISGSFGSSLAINKNDLIVGDALDKLNPESVGSFDRAGAVYTYRFVREKGKWIFVNKIVKENRDENDMFGSHLDLNDSIGVVTSEGKDRGGLFVIRKNTAGEWIIINSPEENLTAVGEIKLNSSGLIFSSDIDLGRETDENKWKVVTASIDGSGQFSNFKQVTPIHEFEGRRFGRSALALGEEYCFVNSHYKPENGKRLSNRGNVHIFRKDSLSEEWIEVQKIVSPDLNKADFFGNSMDFENDYLIVGAIGDNYNDENELIEYRGGAYLYHMEGDSLNLISKIPAPNKAWNKFGFSVAIEGEDVLIGSRLESYGDTVKNAGGAYIIRFHRE